MQTSFKSALNLLHLFAFSVLLASCQPASDKFGSSVYVEFFMVVAIVLVLIFVISRIGRK